MPARPTCPRSSHRHRHEGGPARRLRRDALQRRLIR